MEEKSIMSGTWKVSTAEVMFLRALEVQTLVALKTSLMQVG